MMPDATSVAIADDRTSATSAGASRRLALDLFGRSSLAASPSSCPTARPAPASGTDPRSCGAPRRSLGPASAARGRGADRNLARLAVPSIALIGFGADSLVECAEGVLVPWRSTAARLSSD
jgi:hypothetical protein